MSNDDDPGRYDDGESHTASDDGPVHVSPEETERLYNEVLERLQAAGFSGEEQ